MNESWPWAMLGDLCERITKGSSPKWQGFHYVSEPGILFVTSENVGENEILLNNPKYVEEAFNEKDSRSILKRGDVLTNLVGASIGRTAIYDRDDVANINQAVGILRCVPERINNRYLAYLLNSPVFKDILHENEVDNARANLSLTFFKNLRIPLPPLAEQQRIVRLLDEAFEGLATAKANAEKNLQNAHALFESHLQSVFTQRGPEWKMEKLDDLTELARGHNPPKSKFSREQKPGYVRFYQIRDGGTDDYTTYVPDTPQLHKMKKDDIMMVAYRHVGRAFRGVEGAFNVALCKISNARRDLLDDDYLFHMIPSPFVKGELLKRSERSLIPSMSIEHLRELRIPLPPLPEQQRIVKLINSLLVETQRLASLYERKLAALEALKKSLLHQAFTGEL